MQLEVRNLYKSYGKKEALCGVSFLLTPGVYGLLGPNGAGKSTLISILTGNLKADRGEVLLDDKPTEKMGAAYRKQLGYMPQQQAVYSGFTAAGFLDYMAALKAMEKDEARQRIPEVLKLVGLFENARDKIKTFSGGMKQRLLIAQAILDDPAFIVLDEPTAGLDPKQRIAVRNLISKIALNKIVLIATHVVSDVEFISKEVILLGEGKVLQKAPRDRLVKSMRSFVYEVEVPESEADKLQADWTVAGISKLEGRLYVRVVAEHLQTDWPCRAVRPSLEDVYLYYFGGE